MVDLKEEVPGIILLVLAIACILIPLYFLIGKFFLTNQENTNAQNTLNVLMTKVADLKVGEGNIFTVQGFNGADNWYLVGWSKDEPGRPDKCFFLNGCLCLCKLGNLGDSFTHSINPGDLSIPADKENIFRASCQSDGFCKETKISLISLETINLNDANQNIGKFVVLSSYIHLPTNLLSISISKSTTKDNNGNAISSLDIKRSCDNTKESCPAREQPAGNIIG